MSGVAVRCGKCTGCLNLRRWKWETRARLEAFMWERVWFLTVTFRPGAPDTYSEFQLFMKRLRKSGHSVRFVSGEEKHKSGKLHFHALLYCQNSLTRRQLEKHWSAGFSDAKLAKHRHFRYVSKYVMKGGRIRSSVGLGLATLRECAVHLMQVTGGDLGEATIVRYNGMAIPILRNYGDWSQWENLAALAAKRGWTVEQSDSSDEDRGATHEARKAPCPAPGLRGEPAALAVGSPAAIAAEKAALAAYWGVPYSQALELEIATSTVE